MSRCLPWLSGEKAILGFFARRACPYTLLPARMCESSPPGSRLALWGQETIRPQDDHGSQLLHRPAIARCR